tara:strand:+ start:11213 stop:11827 length:615 start_codon:yes stop_codon:yes gene_type:complete
MLEASPPTVVESLTGGLARLVDEDALAIPYLTEEVRAAMVECCERLAFRSARPVLGKPGQEVYQDLELTTDIPQESPLFDLAHRLEADLQVSLSRLSPAPLDYPFVINDFIVQRYSPGQNGITPHRDHVRYRGIVAIIVLSGSGRFWVCDDRKGTHARTVPESPGDLLLMRAPDFAGMTDRPFHALSDITRTRYSFGMRYDVSL